MKRLLMVLALTSLLAGPVQAGPTNPPAPPWSPFTANGAPNPAFDPSQYGGYYGGGGGGQAPSTSSDDPTHTSSSSSLDMTDRSHDPSLAPAPGKDERTPAMPSVTYAPAVQAFQRVGRVLSQDSRGLLLRTADGDVRLTYFANRRLTVTAGELVVTWVYPDGRVLNLYHVASAPQ